MCMKPVAQADKLNPLPVQLVVFFFQVDVAQNKSPRDIIVNPMFREPLLRCS